MKKILKNTKQFQNERKNYESIKNIISRMFLEPSINLDIRHTKLPASQRDMLRRILNYIEPIYINKTTIVTTREIRVIPFLPYFNSSFSFFIIKSIPFIFLLIF